MPGGVFSTAKLHAMTIRESADDGSDFTNPDADYRRLFLGEDGNLHLRDSAGTVTDIVGAAAHIADTTDAHDASAVSFDATGLDNTTATEVQTALEEFDAAITAGGGGGAAELLASLSYRPGSDTTIATNSTNTIADIDATNLAITFTAPASGNVLVRVTGTIELATSSIKRWGLRESTTTLAENIVASNTAVSDSAMCSVFKITGISGGSHTYKWAHRAATGSVVLIGGPTFGEAVMEVWSA